MTERLYYTDAYVVEFDARILRIEEYDGRSAAILDRTAFYPTSGGQPFDTGTLGPARVVDVVDRDDGVILHILERAIEPGPAHGRVDWERRFDHMQQHTGQHVLSAAFDRLLQARTESFHLGSTGSTIDLAREVTAADISQVEEEANRIVWQERPVHIRFADAAEAAAMPLRKDSARTGTLRLVDIEGCDLSACGGTHVARTGAIGVIAVTSWERFRGGTRVEFVCGARALRSHRALRDVVAASVRVLSVLPAELAAGIERLQVDAKDMRREIKALQGRLAGHEASALAARGTRTGDVHVIIEALEGWDAGGLKNIAAAIVTQPGQIAVLFSTLAPGAIVAARSADVAIDCGALLRRLTAQFGGKGGGRPELAQGGGLQGSATAIADFVKQTIREHHL